jgi:hypothetical protein
MRRLAGAMLLIAAGMVLTPFAADEPAYLSSIGPAPMRFEWVTNNGVLLAWKPLRTVPQPVANASVPALGGETLVNASNNAVLKTLSLSATNGSALRAVSVPVADTGEKPNLETSSVPGIFSDPPAVTSKPMVLQELAYLFQSVPGGKNTNGTAVLVPVKIGFTPPLPTAVESRAVYKTQ